MDPRDLNQGVNTARNEHPPQHQGFVEPNHAKLVSSEYSQGPWSLFPSLPPTDNPIKNSKSPQNQAVHHQAQDDIQNKENMYRGQHPSQTPQRVYQPSQTLQNPQLCTSNIYSSRLSTSNQQQSSNQDQGSVIFENLPNPPNPLALQPLFKKSTGFFASGSLLVASSISRPEKKSKVFDVSEDIDKTNPIDSNHQVESQIFMRSQVHEGGGIGVGGKSMKQGREDEAFFGVRDENGYFHGRGEFEKDNGVYYEQIRLRREEERRSGQKEGQSEGLFYPENQEIQNSEIHQIREQQRQNTQFYALQQTQQVRNHLNPSRRSQNEHNLVYQEHQVNEALQYTPSPVNQNQPHSAYNEQSNSQNRQQRVAQNEIFSSSFIARPMDPETNQTALETSKAQPKTPQMQNQPILIFSKGKENNPNIENIENIEDSLSAMKTLNKKYGLGLDHLDQLDDVPLSEFRTNTPKTQIHQMTSQQPEEHQRDDYSQNRSKQPLRDIHNTRHNQSHQYNKSRKNIEQRLGSTLQDQNKQSPDFKMTLEDPFSQKDGTDKFVALESTSENFNYYSEQRSIGTTGTKDGPSQNLKKYKSVTQRVHSPKLRGSSAKSDSLNFNKVSLNRMSRDTKKERYNSYHKENLNFKSTQNMLTTTATPNSQNEQFDDLDAGYRSEDGIGYRGQRIGGNGLRQKVGRAFESREEDVGCFDQNVFHSEEKAIEGFGEGFEKPSQNRMADGYRGGVHDQGYGQDDKFSREQVGRDFQTVQLTPGSAMARPEMAQYQGNAIEGQNYLMYQGKRVDHHQIRNYGREGSRSNNDRNEPRIDKNSQMGYQVPTHGQEKEVKKRNRVRMPVYSEEAPNQHQNSHQTSNSPNFTSQQDHGFDQTLGAQKGPQSSSQPPPKFEQFKNQQIRENEFLNQPVMTKALSDLQRGVNDRVEQVFHLHQNQTQQQNLNFSKNSFKTPLDHTTNNQMVNQQQHRPEASFSDHSAQFHQPIHQVSQNHQKKEFQEEEELTRTQTRYYLQKDTSSTKNYSSKLNEGPAPLFVDNSIDLKNRNRPRSPYLKKWQKYASVDPMPLHDNRSSNSHTHYYDQKPYMSTQHPRTWSEQKPFYATKLPQNGIKTHLSVQATVPLAKNLKYVGDIFDGEIHGQGVILTYSGDLLYEGGFERGLYSGKGKLINYRNKAGIKHLNVKAEISRRYLTLSKSNYTGDLRGVRGFGSVNFEEDGWVVYDGFFEAGKMNGQGRLEFLDGRVYEGSFEDGQASGYGLLSLGEKKVVALWKKNIVETYL